LLLNNLNGGKFAGYAAGSQPAWLRLTLNGQLPANYNIIARNGEILNLNGKGNKYTTNAGNTNLAGRDNYGLFLLLELIGKNFDYSPYTCNNCETGQQELINIKGTSLLGTYYPGDLLSRYIAPLATTQAVILRFRLYLVAGNWTLFHSRSTTTVIQSSLLLSQTMIIIIGILKSVSQSVAIRITESLHSLS
jgi:hypothetical protein